MPCFKASAGYFRLFQPFSLRLAVLIKPYYEQLAAVVRQSSENLILATGNSYAFDLRGIAGSPIADSNVAYSRHVYASGPIDEPLLNVFLAGVDGIAPVVVSEWGFDFSAPASWPENAANFGPAFVEDFLCFRRLHSSAWAWAPGWNPSLLEADWSTSTLYGKFVKEFLRGNTLVRAKVQGRKSRNSFKPSVRIRGATSAPLGVDRIEVLSRGGKSRSCNAGEKWLIRVHRLKPGRNRLPLTAIDIGGRRSKPVALRIHRSKS